jgi:hypothetical protein
MKVAITIIIETEESLEDLLELAQDFGDSLQGDFDPDNALVEVVDERTPEEAFEMDEEAYKQHVREYVESRTVPDTETINQMNYGH